MAAKCIHIYYKYIEYINVPEVTTLNNCRMKNESLTVNKKAEYVGMTGRTSTNHYSNHLMSFHNERLKKNLIVIIYLAIKKSAA